MHIEFEWQKLLILVTSPLPSNSTFGDEGRDPEYATIAAIR